MLPETLNIRTHWLLNRNPPHNKLYEGLWINLTLVLKKTVNKYLVTLLSSTKMVS